MYSLLGDSGSGRIRMGVGMMVLASYNLGSLKGVIFCRRCSLASVIVEGGTILRDSSVRRLFTVSSTDLAFIHHVLSRSLTTSNHAIAFSVV